MKNHRTAEPEVKKKTKKKNSGDVSQFSFFVFHFFFFLFFFLSTFEAKTKQKDKKKRNKLQNDPSFFHSLSLERPVASANEKPKNSIGAVVAKKMKKEKFESIAVEIR